MLLLSLLILHVIAGGTGFPRQTTYTTRHVDTCPDVGYYFKREMSNAVHPSPGVCHLCFCRDNNTAVCWERENKRCDEQHYHHVLKRRDTRQRRSPAGLSDIFFRDAARDLFNKQAERQCDPFESSYSEGCPPADWCIGCTVCDCDANGRWDCHILSFCPDANSKTKSPKYPPAKGKSKVTQRRNRKSKVPITKGQFKATTKITLSKNKIVVKDNKTGKDAKQASSRQTKKIIPMRRSENVKSSPINKSSPPAKAKATTKQPAKKIVYRSSQVQKTPVRTPSSKKTFATKKRAVTGKMSPTNKKPTTKSPPHSSNNKNQHQKPKNQPVRRNLQTISTAKPAGNTKKRFIKKGKPTTIFGIAPSSRPVGNTSKSAYISHKPTLKPFDANNFSKQISQDIVKKFMSAVRKMVVQKSEEFKPKVEIKPKRKVQSDSSINYDTEKNNTDFGGDKLTNILNSTNKRNKRQYINTGPMKKMHAANNRPKREVTTTKELVLNSTANSGNENSTKPIEDFVERTTTKAPDITTVIISGYYKYSIDNMIQNNTSFNTADYDQTLDTITKNYTVKRSIQKTHDKDKSLNISTHVSDNNINNHTNFNNSLSQSQTLIVPLNTILDVNSTIKFNELSQIKSFEKEEENLRTELSKVTVTTRKPNLTLNLLFNNDYSVIPLKKVSGKDIKRKIEPGSKKYKLKKLINTLNNKTFRDERVYLKNQPLIHKLMNTTNFNNKNNTNYFINFFKKLFSGFAKNKLSVKGREKRLKAVKYMQKFFRKIFSRGKNKKNHTKIEVNRHHVIETLCASFGPCNLNADDRKQMNLKIDNLSDETHRMLRYITIIKGLLKLLDFTKNDKHLKRNDLVEQESHFNDDIQKLHIILKGNYSTENCNLTETQNTQISYIQSNTQSFIESAAKFATILNELIDIVSVNKNKTPWLRMARCAKDKGECKLIERKSNKKDAFEKFKVLLLKYNLLQNTFMRGLYKVLNDLDTTNVKTKKKYVNVNKDFKKSEHSTKAVQIYTNNVIKNLRKLKYLAQTMNLGGRIKRELRDDDSLEYLLIMMEILLRQDRKLDVAPANDGIDLLIDAIKNAPDIKPTKKRVLEDSLIPIEKPKDVPNSYTAISTKPLAKLNVVSEDSASNINNMSNEDFKKLSHENNSTSALDDLNLNVIRDLADNEIDEEDKYTFNRKPLVQQRTETDYYKKEEEELTISNHFETTTEQPPRLQVAIRLQEKPQSVIDADTYNKVITRIANSMSSTEEGDVRSDDFKNFDVFTADLDDDVTTAGSGITTSEYSETETETTTEFTRPMKYTEDANFDKIEMRYYKNNISGSENKYKKLKLNWIDESYEEDIQRTNSTIRNTNSALEVPVIATTAVLQKSKENVSKLSKEDEYIEKKDSDMKELLYNKEMDLLNSLDYGTEKYEKDSSSKEVSDSIASF